MPTTTTRLGLDKPAYNEAADIAVLNTNFDDIDAAVGLKVVTSTTRPATPWDGQLIFETDTNQTLMWDATASAWKYVGGAAIVCTSTTRPASPLNGQIIYETDTRRVLVYSTAATAWRVPFLEYSVADFTALAALTGMVAGNVAFVTEGSASMVYSGSAWIQQNVTSFSTTAARDTAYAKASAVYRVTGAESRVGAVRYFYNGTEWIGDNLYCVVNRSSASATFTAGTATVVLFNAEISDPANMHDNTTNSSRITVPVAGLYAVDFNTYSGQTTGTIAAILRKNGTDVVGSFQRRLCDANAGGSINLSNIPVQCVANDYIEVFVTFQNSGGTLAGSTTNQASTIAVLKRLGD